MNKNFDTYLKLYDKYWSTWFADTYAVDVVRESWADDLAFILEDGSEINDDIKYVVGYDYSKDAWVAFFISYKLWTNSKGNPKFPTLREKAFNIIKTDELKYDKLGDQLFEVLKELDSSKKSVFAEQVLAELDYLQSGLMDSYWNPDYKEY